MLESRINGVTAKSFAWLAEDEFVTEFYKGKEMLGFWTAPAVLNEEGRVDQEALAAFHEVNCDIFKEDPHGSFWQEEEGSA